MLRAAVLVSASLVSGCGLFGSSTPPAPLAPLADGARPPESHAPEPQGVLADRVVVRWFSPDTGGVGKPQFVFARELAFEARIEGLIDPEPDGTPYRDRHVRAALDRHIAETLLASLAIVPEPKPEEIAARAEAARAVLEQRVGGRDRLLAAAAAEGMGSDELDALLRRQAKASLYLDRMVAPMLEPSELELRALHGSGTTPFTSTPFDKLDKDALARLKRLYVGVRLAQALDAYYQNARSRVHIVTIKKP